MKKIVVSLLSISLLCALLVSVFSFVDKNKFLENKKFDVTFYEIKASGSGKPQKSMVQIKGGKVYDELMEEKLALPQTNYVVTLDSTYTEDGDPVHMVSFEAYFSEEKNEYKWEATVINYDIEGTVVLSKGGVEKKKYEFSGSEITKK